MQNNSPLISFVIPFYNVEKYIAQCLNSVYCQDIPEEDYEVICVNDASPDNSREIVISFQGVHSNLILVDHDVNKKLGSARNTGRTIARGKYIWNIDSDDYIKPNILKKLINDSEQSQLDILMFNFDHYSNGIEKLNIAFPFKISTVYSGIDFINNFCLNNFGEISPVWSQLYRREFLNENNIYSPPINMGEDVPYTLKAILMAKRVMSITTSCYVYRANEDSLGGIIEVTPNAIRLYEKCFQCTEYVYILINLIPKNEKQIIAAYLSVSKYIISLFPSYLKNMNNEELNNFRKICRNNFINDIKLIKLLNKKNMLTYLFSIVIPLFPIKNNRTISYKK